MKTQATRALALSAALALSLTGMAQAQRSGTTRQVSLPSGTVLRAELNDRLSSTDSRPGDRFTATIRQDDGYGLPSGTEVSGVVRTVRRASDNQPGTIDVDFTSLRLPNGGSYPIQGSLTSLDSKSVRRTSDGRLEARNRSSSDKTKFIGYGAGAGALIGILGGSDLLKSALLGAAAGYLYGELNKDKATRGRYSDVNLKEGTEFGVLLDRQLVVAGSGNRYGSYNRRYPNDNPNRNADRYGSDDSYRTNNRRTGAYDRYGNNDIRVLVNEREVRFNGARPFMSAGRVMVPVEPVLEAADYRYDYDTQDRELTVRGDRGDARIIVGDYYATVDGERVRMATPAQRIDGVLYVPTQFLDEATDIRSSWDASGRTLRLTTRSRASRPF